MHEPETNISRRRMVHVYRSPHASMHTYVYVRMKQAKNLCICTHVINGQKDYAHTWTLTYMLTAPVRSIDRRRGRLQQALHVHMWRTCACVYIYIHKYMLAYMILAGVRSIERVEDYGRLSYEIGAEEGKGDIQVNFRWKCSNEKFRAFFLTSIAKSGHSKTRT